MMDFFPGYPGLAGRPRMMIRQLNECRIDNWLTGSWVEEVSLRYCPLLIQ